MKTLWLLAAAAFLATGCNSFSGKVAGKDLAVQDALFFPYKVNGAVHGASFILSDKPKLCDTLKANRVPKSSTLMVVTLARITTSDSLPPDVGDYTMTASQTVQPGNYGAGFFIAFDTACTDTISSAAGTAQSGLVKVSSYKGEVGGSIAGTFDITWGSQNDRSQGGFNAAYCDLGNNFPTAPNCE